ncbi:TrkH family potassium uptake protein [Lyngbya sp. CCY1209]|uniref:TrkH family potassium uptake protein n=1 Tax=Lyngbya sp. CCY1209 TaxID=2886103 RepID=UPI002D208B4B|nr:TrkH family potassium uptake protein [Lyngbya sp. CCY1209]MEB3885453.1 TrkH family potassium uptake protein [Lyngbya sp. CCY1209]
MTVPRTICLGFLAVIAIGTFLLWMDDTIYNGSLGNPVTALFTATSAVCVTGLSVVDVGQFYSFWGQLCLLGLVEIGALGYMTANTVLLMLIGRKFGLRDKLALQKSLDTAGLGGVMPLLRSIIATMALFQLTGIILLMIVFVPDWGLRQGLWLSIFHSINGFNNAGFSLFPNSLVAYTTSPVINFTMSLLIIFGGLGYQAIMELYLWFKNQFTRDPMRREFSIHFKVVGSTTIFLLLAGTILFFVTEFNNPETLQGLSFFGKIQAAWFQSVTTRTAGFNSINVGEMTHAGIFITMILMFIGASPGSTGGGIKTTTSRILVNCTKAALEGRDEVLCYQRKIPATLLLKAVGVLVGSTCVVFFATLLIVLIQPKLGFGNVFFEIVSAFGTVGLSTGITGSLSIPSRLVAIATMYVGRVGVLLLMSALLGDPKPSAIDYPEENLLVG